MRVRQMTLSAAFAAAMTALPLASASAQFAGPPCSPFPLAWPFCIAGAVAYGAATIVTAPFRAIAGQPYYGRPYYAPPPPPAYYPGTPSGYPQQPYSPNPR